jgi:hypothetical protein
MVEPHVVLVSSGQVLRRVLGLKVESLWKGGKYRPCGCGRMVLSWCNAENHYRKNCLLCKMTHLLG